MSTVRRITLTQWILISMVVGLLIGWAFPESGRATAPLHFAGTDLKVLSNVFLRLIKSLIVPLIFSTLVVGIAGHGDDMKRVGKLALRSIIYFEIITTLALVVGLVAVNLTKPGVGVALNQADAAQTADFTKTHITFTGVVEHAVPQSFFEGGTNNEVLQIVVFAIIFAAALSRVPAEPKKFMLAANESLSEVMF